MKFVPEQLRRAIGQPTLTLEAAMAYKTLHDEDQTVT